MPILNYTTEIPAYKTVGEIMSVLAKAGAQAISIDYDANREPAALTFLIEIKGVPINFRLPIHFDGVYKALLHESKVPRRLRTEKQAQRVAWRIVKDWVEAQMAIIEAGQAELAEVFLPYAVTNSGRTLFQAINPQLLLEA